LVLCDDNGDGDGVEEFDLTQAAADIKDNGSNYILTYYTTQEDAQNEVNPIADPSAYESGTGSVWVRVALDTHNPAEPMCAQIVELPLIVNPLPPVADLEPFAHCEQNTDGAYDFNIQEYVNNALGGNEADEYDVDFFEDAALTTPAVPVTAYPVTGGSGTVYVRVTNNDTGCMIVKELSLLVEEGAIANPITTVFDECDYDGANDGIISTWDLTVVEGEVLGTQDPAGYEVTYYTSLEDAENYENAIATPEAYTNTIADDQTIWVRVTNTATLSKCHDITTFTLHVERLAEPVITGENGSNTVCVDVDGTTDGLLLDSGVAPAGHSYRWFLDGVELTDADPSSGTYLAVSEGDYTVEVTGPLPNACVSDLSAVFTVIKSGMASPVGAGYYVTNYFSDNQVITITVEGNGEYVYQLDEGPTQTSPVFTNVSPGPHTVRVYDVKTEFSCGVLPIEGVSVVDYPNFFTPNGDGFHDTWNIIGLQNTGSVIYIFDRYGKLIKQISPDLESDGWDGTFNGTPLPADDYWFSVTYPEFDGTTTVTREFKAHFSLKR
jgi:gliding motility-associated-like protein